MKPGQILRWSCCLAIALLIIEHGASAESAVSLRADGWTLENARLRVTLDPRPGRLAVLDKAAGHLWEQPPDKGNNAGDVGPRFRLARSTANEPDGITFDADFRTDDGRQITLIVTMALPADSARLVVECDMADRNATFATCFFLDPFVLDATDGALLATDYCGGHLYPLDLESFPDGSVLRNSLAWFAADRLDMPWVGLCDLDTGLGYSVIIDTSDDAVVACRKHEVGSRQLFAPQVVWRPSKGTFRYPRRIIYCFTGNGGYVALAKAYRAHAKKQGLIVTLTEKMEKNPNVARLLGAVNVWDVSAFALAPEAKRLGIEKMLLQYGLDREKVPRDRIEAANDLGYLTSEYDEYTDVLPATDGQPPGFLRDIVPDSIILTADGKRATGWKDLEGNQYMQRCPRLWEPTARKVIPAVLEAHPYNARFIDVTTSIALSECYDEKHPQTRSQTRQCGAGLLRYTRSCGLVTGGEHGVYWAVPYLDWIEGMMSGPYYSWPAGYLKRPRSKDETFTTPLEKHIAPWSTYETWNMGHRYRVPLWELVFHDCVVSTWYWGDTNDWLLTAAPEMTARKDAFNILYGTMPMLWADAEGAWQKDRDLFLRTYRTVCKLHEVIGAAEMVSHAFVTSDRAVQRTRFADGTEVIVNLGVEPRNVRLGGDSHMLPQYGFAVKGPRIEQSRVLVNGKEVTTIRTEDYHYTDAPGAVP